MTKLFRGGGTIADTLNAVPNAIDKMLKENYKKIASGTCSVSLREATNLKVTIPLNLEFKPSRLFFVISFKSNGNFYKEWYDTESLNSHNGFSINIKGDVGYGDSIGGFFNNSRILTKESAILDLYISIYKQSSVSAKITDWIAIE